MIRADNSGTVGNEAGAYLPLAARAYVPLADPQRQRRSRSSPGPSEWVLVFDTETTTDPALRLRFGTFQLRYAGRLVKHGVFYEPDTLSKRERSILVRYPRSHGLELLTRV